MHVHEALADSIDDWVTDGDPSTGPVPRAVRLQALYEQRIYRVMTRRERLGDETLSHLDGVLRVRAGETVDAGRQLRSLVTPVEPPVRMKTQPAEPAGVLLRYYRKAERRFEVDWAILAAVNMVETRFGRIRTPSSAGAQGPMQFLPSTWDAYGMGGDINDPHDAILGAANYLRASGAPSDYRRALYAYNHSDAYVDAVLLHARWMRRKPQRYFVFYNWHVFVITTVGDKRLTGPKPRN